MTVIGTGKAPFELIENAKQRDYFYEAPVEMLNDTRITRLISPFAQASFTQVFGELTAIGMNEMQIEILKDQLTMAHNKGIGLRYWDIPEWPVSTRNTIWRQLRTEGLDLLNADNLQAAAGYEDNW